MPNNVIAMKIEMEISQNHDSSHPQKALNPGSKKCITSNLDIHSQQFNEIYTNIFQRRQIYNIWLQVNHQKDGAYAFSIYQFTIFLGGGGSTQTSRVTST